MNMQAAINDFVITLQGIQGLSVLTQNEVPGSADFTLAISHGSLETEYVFGGKKKLKQQFGLALASKGPSNQPATVYLMNKTIKDTVEADRRRGGNAQTTVVELWETEEDNGRDGLNQTLIVEIHTYEN